LEGGDRLGALTAGQRADHRRLAMTLYGQLHQQLGHRRKHLGSKLVRADAGAQREIIGMDNDLRHPGEQEVISAQGPSLPGNQHVPHQRSA
jgi:hypothetical protein